MSKSLEKNDFSTILALSHEAIKEEIVKNKKALFQFRFQPAGEGVKPHIIRSVRRHVARLKTALTMKNSESVGK
jgi:ribosomal protein L29